LLSEAWSALSHLVSFILEGLVSFAPPNQLYLAKLGQLQATWSALFCKAWSALHHQTSFI